MSSEPNTIPLDRSLLLVDDDEAWLNHLAKAMKQRGFDVCTALSITEATIKIATVRPSYAVVDLRLEDGSGLEIVQQLRDMRHDVRIVMLTGYGNIATTVAAVKMGAVDYLAKPADVDEIESALLVTKGKKPSPPPHPMSANRVRWEHIQRVYELCDRNISETARRLNMHRRTLQRILAKHAPQ